MSKSPKKPEHLTNIATGVETTTTAGSAAGGEPLLKSVDLSKPLVKDAIAQGLTVIKDGKSKADAARAMYSLLKDEDKDLIVAAFVVGATLTEKGALTYWYNCKRRTSREARVASKTT